MSNRKRRSGKWLKWSSSLAMAFVIASMPFTAGLADDTAGSFYDQGVRLMKDKKFKDAIQSFDMSIGMAATDSRAFMRRAQCFF